MIPMGMSRIGAEASRHVPYLDRKWDKKFQNVSAGSKTK